MLKLKLTATIVAIVLAQTALAGAPPGVHITAQPKPAIPQGAPPGVHITIRISPPVRS